MFKPRRQRNHQSQNLNPISDMEQFYLNQYFQSQLGGYIPNPSAHPNVIQANDRSSFSQAESTNFQQLELRIARIEQYLGLSATESRAESIIR